MISDKNFQSIRKSLLNQKWGRLLVPLMEFIGNGRYNNIIFTKDGDVVTAFPQDAFKHLQVKDILIFSK